MSRRKTHLPSVSDTIQMIPESARPAFLVAYLSNIIQNAPAEPDTTYTVPVAVLQSIHDSLVLLLA